MQKRKIELHSGKAVFIGPMTTEAIRGKAEEFEALVGHYPRILVAAPTLSGRALMPGQHGVFEGTRPVVSIHRMFVRLDLGKGRTLDVCPEQVPDLVVEYHLVQ